MNHQFAWAIVSIGVVALSACGANTRERTMQASGATTAHADRQPEAFAHGAEVEHGSSIIVSDGNYHAAFGPGATYARTASGVVVTFNGVKRTFSPTARVESGTYHRYAKASDHQR
jgi:hypothetical protein